MFDTQIVEGIRQAAKNATDLDRALLAAWNALKKVEGAESEAETVGKVWFDLSMLKNDLNTLKFGLRDAGYR